jgi:hypothetical protein
MTEPPQKWPAPSRSETCQGADVIAVGSPSTIADAGR